MSISTTWSKWVLSLSLILSLILLLTNVALARQTEMVTDDLGYQIQLDDIPETIISLAPNSTELLFSLGLGDKVIGVSQECNYPLEMLERVEAGEISSIGTVLDPNVERILELEPDLVLADSLNSLEDVERLKELGVVVVALDPNDLDSSFLAMERVGRLTGYQKEASMMIGQMKSKLEKIDSLVLKQREKPTLFIEIWDDPLITAGRGTFIDYMIERAGAINLGAETGEGWPLINMETLLYEDPDIYIISTHSAGGGVDEIGERNNFSHLTAVQEDRVYLLHQEIISRPSPRLIKGLVELVSAIYPELAFELRELLDI